MTRRPSMSEQLAMRAAAAAARQVDEPEPEPVAPPKLADAEPEVIEPTDAAPKARRGRPRGRRPVEARQTIYLDKARHDALARIAEDRGRSVHSLIIEGIDQVIGKPSKPGWQN